MSDFSQLSWSLSFYSLSRAHKGEAVTGTIHYYSCLVLCYLQVGMLSLPLNNCTFTCFKLQLSSIFPSRMNLRHLRFYIPVPDHFHGTTRQSRLQTTLTTGQPAH